MVWPNGLHIKNKIENPKTYWEKSPPKQRLFKDYIVDAIVLWYEKGVFYL